jgi:lactoylglutathione lyase
MDTKRQIHSPLKVLLVSDIERAKNYYSEVLGCEVTDWWVLRDGFTGLAIKLLAARDPQDIKPNSPAAGMEHGFDLYCYVENWQSLDELYNEFKTKGATIVMEPWVDAKNGPWKEFALQDLDGYTIAFGGTDGH